MNQVNLIPTRRLQAKERSRRRMQWVTVLALHVLLLLAGSLMFQNFARDEGPNLGQENRDIAIKLNQANRVTASLKREMVMASQKLQTARMIGEQPDWGAMLAVLSQNTDEDVLLDRCALGRIEAPSGAAAPGGPVAGAELRLELGGCTRAQAAVSQYVLHLEQLGLFQKIRLVKTSRERLGGQDAVRFGLECVLQENESKTQ